MRAQTWKESGRENGPNTNGLPGSASVSALPGRAEADAALMRTVRANRDRAALNELACHYAPRLKAWLMHRGEQNSTAEDIVQDVFIAIWTKSALFDPQKASFSTWAYRITRNKWVDYKRKYDRLQPTAPDLISQLADSPVEGADREHERSEASIAVHHQLALLSPEQKQMLHLAFFEGLSHSEIAKRTGLPLGTVKSRIRTPLKKMQAGLKNFSGVDQ